MSTETGAAGAAPAPHPAFRRSLSAFTRLGTVLRPALSREGGLPDAHPTYRAVVSAIPANPRMAPLLADASLLDRAAYELGLFSRLLRAATADVLLPGPDNPGAAETAFATAPSVRLVRTRWDWDGFLGDSGRAEPLERGATWLLNVPPTGPLQVRRLQPLPALLLEAAAWPLTRAAATAAVAERVDGDPARIAATVQSQVDELCAAGLLRPFAPTAADHAVREMRRLLLPEEAPHGGARSLAGLLARAVRSLPEYAEAALRAGEAPYPVNRLDKSVALLDQLLAGAHLRTAFATELDGYWAGADAASRVAALSPLFDVLGRALGSGVHALPPYVMRP